MPNLFSKTLVKLRKGAAFPTAYQFYHHSGGRDVLKLSFRKYLMIEKGINIPRPERLPLFLVLLRIPTGTAKAKELMTAYFKTSCGEDFFDSMIAPFISTKPESMSSSPMQETLKRALSDRIYNITPKQMEVIAKSPQTYWCFNVLANDTGSWDKKKLAELLKMSPVNIGKALKRLAKVGIVKEIKKGVFKSPLAGKTHRWPLRRNLHPGIMRNIDKYREDMKSRGQLEYFCRNQLRVDELDFKTFLPFMANNVTACNAYSIKEKTEHSAFFLIESTVTKLFPF